MHAKLKIYQFHGVDFTPMKEESLGTCPFCDKEDHLFIKTVTGQYECKSCTRSGNAYTFLKQLYSLGHKVTASRDLIVLSKDRGVTSDTLSKWGVVCHPLLAGSYLIPSYNEVGSLCNLYRYDGGTVLSSPGCKQHPFVSQQNSVYPIIWITEGVWDAMALYEAMSLLTEDGTEYSDSLLMLNLVVAIPGVSSFRREWVERFLMDGKTINICFDNDHPRSTGNGSTIQPAYTGVQRTIKLLGNHPNRINYLQWGTNTYHTPDYKSGYDLRDLFSQFKSVDGFKWIRRHLKKACLQKPAPKPKPEVKSKRRKLFTITVYLEEEEEL